MRFSKCIKSHVITTNERLFHQSGGLQFFEIPLEATPYNFQSNSTADLSIIIEISLGLPAKIIICFFR